MPLTPEQIKSLKEQLKTQVQHLPAEQKKEAEKHIESMSAGAIELMLKQQTQASSQSTEKIFRSIVAGKTPSKLIDQNKEAIAVLDIKPISQGHAIIIPKNPITDSEKIPTRVFILAKTISKKIKSKLKSTSTEIQTEFKFGEIIINVIPIYKNSLNINSPRHDASEKELSEVFEKLKAKSRQKKTKRIVKLKRKIP